jgi:hypothetical protein
VTRIAFLDTDAGAAGVLYRALRPGSGFRFVSIAEGDDYEVVREDGTPDVEGGVLLIDPFEVATGEDEAFLAGWDDARGAQQGYVGGRLYRATGSEAFRYVEIARWSSPLMVQRAGIGGALYLPV